MKDKFSFGKRYFSKTYLYMFLGHWLVRTKTTVAALIRVQVE